MTWCGREVLDRAEQDEDAGRDQRDGQEHAHHGADQVGEEVADPPAVVGAGEAAGERGRHGHADGGADEVLHGEAGHLHEVADRGLAGVPLPVGVGHEADRGVPGAVLREGGEAEGERQVLLEATDAVEDQDADHAEAEDREGVGPPVLVGVRVDPQHAVRRPFDGQVPVAGVDVGQEPGQRRDRQDEQDDECCDLTERREDLAHRSDCWDERCSARSRAPTSRASPANAASVTTT